MFILLEATEIPVPAISEESTENSSAANVNPSPAVYEEPPPPPPPPDEAIINSPSLPVVIVIFDPAEIYVFKLFHEEDKPVPARSSELIAIENIESDPIDSVEEVPNIPSP